MEEYNYIFLWSLLPKDNDDQIDAWKFSSIYKLKFFVIYKIRIVKYEINSMKEYLRYLNLKEIKLNSIFIEFRETFTRPLLV